MPLAAEFYANEPIEANSLFFSFYGQLSVNLRWNPYHKFTD